MTGPDMSLGAPAETQVWSSGGSSISLSAVMLVSAGWLVAEVLGVFGGWFVSVGSEVVVWSLCLRFLGLSPLNVSGFTIVVFKLC